MKLLLVIVSIVAVFTVNGRDFHKEPATGNSANEADGKDLHFQDRPIGDNSFEGGLKLQDFEEQDHQLKLTKGDHERTLRRSRCKARNACVVMGGFCVTNATLCGGRLVPDGCKGTNCQCCVPGTIEAKLDNFEQELQSLKANMNRELHSMKVNMNTSNSFINSQLDSLKNNTNTGNSNLNTKLQSLKNNMDISNSNLNTELQSMKVNMNNSNSFINAELDSLKNNTNTGNSNLNTKLQSLKNNMDISNSNLNTKLQSIKVNMNTSGSNINTDLQSIKVNINTSNAFINSELDSLKNNTNTGNSNLNTKLQSLKNHMDTSFSNVNSKLENQGCPEGLFLFAPSNQCFKLLSKRSWDSAKSGCSALGLELAESYDPLPLRSYMMTKYGLTAPTWLNARGTGSTFKWQRTGQSISNSNPLWAYSPSGHLSTSYCLLLGTVESYWKSKPNQPYWIGTCSYSHWTLCELVRE